MLTEDEPAQNPGPDGILRRDSRFPDTPPGISRYHESVLHQGRIERFFLDNIRKYSSLPNHTPIAIERATLPVSLTLDEGLAEDPAAYPITVRLRRLTEEEAAPEQASATHGEGRGQKASEEGKAVSDGLFRSNLAADDTDDLVRRTSVKQGEEEVLKAKYVVGCDGAHSWVRKQLGYSLEGEPTDYIWGVLDVVPITDFRECLTPSSTPFAADLSITLSPHITRREKSLC